MNEKLTYEIYLLGTLIQTGLKREKYEQIKQTIRSIFEFEEQYKDSYTIITYENTLTEGIASIKNLIEVHLNNNIQFTNKNFNINLEEFLSKYNPIDNYDEMLKFSKVFIKYIANNKLNSQLGIAKVVEFCRCEENFEETLMMMGYKEKSRINKNFSTFKYRQFPIYLQATNISNDDKTLNVEIFELFGFCMSYEESELVKKMNEVKNELGKILKFVQ